MDAKNVLSIDDQTGSAEKKNGKRQFFASLQHYYEYIIHIEPPNATR